MANDEPDAEYDLAFSFAGEHRQYVEETVRACQKLGLRVFYDKDANNDWWGKNFIRKQREIYSSRTQYFVPFISTEYFAKPIPADEFSSAMMTAVKQGDGYILPVLMEEVAVPVDLLHPHIHYLRAADYTPAQLAEQFVKKLGVATDQGQEPAPIGDVVEQALQLRMPRIVPAAWSKYEELDQIFDYLTTQFQRGAEQLRQRDLVCSVRQREDLLIIRVERGGQTVAGLNVRRGAPMGDDSISWLAGWSNLSSDGSFNGWAKPVFDTESQRALIDINDMNIGSRSNADSAVTREMFFQRLWDILIDQIER